MNQETSNPARISARDRLLAAAEALFYEEGINTVGIDRVIERAGVAKATLYSNFGSKDALICAYLRVRHEARQARVEAMLARHATPRAQLMGMFDLMNESCAEPGYRGCAFVRASAELRSDSEIKPVIDEYRGWSRSLFARLARSAGAREPAKLAQQLVLLYDGAVMAAQMDGSRHAAALAKSMAATLLDAALPAA